MTIIRATCPYCGDLELSPPDLHLQTYDKPGWDYYEFICPNCCQLIKKPADCHVVTALRIGQVSETRTVLPEEMLDPKRDARAPLDYNDLLDFVLELGAAKDLTTGS